MKNNSNRDVMSRFSYFKIPNLYYLIQNNYILGMLNFFPIFIYYEITDIGRTI